MSCELCDAKKETTWFYEDKFIWSCKCKTHLDKIIIVIRRHDSKPNANEVVDMVSLIQRKWPDKKFRGPKSIPEHFHLHEV